MNGIAILNQKGGVGKTSVTLGLGEALAALGHRVLMVDCDPQSNLAASLGADEIEAGLEGVYDDGASLLDLTFETEVTGLFLVPSKARLRDSEQLLVTKTNRDGRLALALRKAQRSSGGEYSFDYVLFDCPPSSGLLTTNALFASRYVIIPTTLTKLAVKGINEQFGAVETLTEAYDGRECTILGVLVNRLDKRQKIENERWFGHLREAVRSNPTLLFKTKIRVCEEISHAQSAGRPVAAYKPRSNAAEDFRQVAAELLARIS